jgi:hypothetical protein
MRWKHGRLSHRVVVVLFSSLGLVSSCCEQPAGGGLTNGAASVEELVDRMLASLRAGDLAALEALRVTKDEYLRLIFPHFKLTGSGSALSADFHWQLLDLKSAKGARHAISEHGGTDLKVLEIRQESKVEDYGHFQLLGKTQVKVRAGGEEIWIRFLGSTVAMGGKFKFLSFRD